MRLKVSGCRHVDPDTLWRPLRIGGTVLTTQTFASRQLVFLDLDGHATEWGKNK